MPLPKINTPTYELVLPSNNKKIKYRPFLVREEKILIIALESQDMKQITDAIVEILNACVMTKGVEITKLATVDVNITCPDDGETSVEMEIPIDAIKVKKTKNHKNIIKLDDQYSMKLKYPELSKFVENNFEVGSDTSDVSKSLSMITSCIEMIYDNEESWDANDSTTEELEEFIEQLNTKQFKEVERFFDTMPKLSHTVKVNNPKTKVESDVVLEGLAAFFT